MTWKQAWANLRCYVAGHQWEHDGPRTWAMTCTRCHQRYFMPRYREDV
jgi:cytochrome c553